MNIYDKTVADIRDRRRAELDEAQIYWQNLLRSDEALHAAYLNFQRETIKSAKGEENNLSAAKETLSAELKRLGYKESDFYPPCRCKVCNDTGRVNGNYCKCVIRAVIDADKSNHTLPEVDMGSAARTAPGAIKKAYSAALEYIKSFPNGKPFFTLLGAPGTGKTVLASAIATEFMQKGASAVSVTAFDFVRRSLDFHTQFNIEKYVDRFTPMLDCDLLVIDDLGKETVLKNVTMEYLYTVVNERWLNKKYTVVTSNLEPSAVLARYGESVTSRLFDKNRSVGFVVKGKDSRL